MQRRWMAAVLLFASLIPAAVSAPQPNDFRFSIVGDRTGTAVSRVYQRVWEEIGRLGPDFVINAGDTIQGGHDGTAEAEWEKIHALLRRYKRFPFYFVPGNHDIWNAYSRKIYERQTGRPAFYSFDYQEAHFVVLDNSLALDLGLEQLQFLENDLKSNRERRPKFIFFHKPFWIFFLKFQNRAFPLHRMAKEYGVDYVISGHGHQLVRMERDGVVYLEVGSSGARIRPSFSQGVFYQHIWAQVNGSAVRLTVMELGPPFGEGRSFDAAGWGENRPKSYRQVRPLTAPAASAPPAAHPPQFAGSAR